MNELLKIICTSVPLVGAIIAWITTYTKGKKKEKFVNYARIIQKLPTIIQAVENVCDKPGSGAVKKIMALNQCQIECNNLNLKYNEEEWSAEIEKILSTPQKKEVNNEKKENAENNR